MKSGRQRHYNGCHFVISNWFFIDNFPAIIAKLCLKNTSIFQNDTDKRCYFVCQYKMFSLNDEGAFYRRLLAKICWTKLLLFSPDKSFPFDSNLIFFSQKNWNRNCEIFWAQLVCLHNYLTHQLGALSKVLDSICSFQPTLLNDGRCFLINYKLKRF